MAITKKRQFEWIARILQEYQAINFYGEITVKFVNGNMILAGTHQSLKPPEEETPHG